MPRPFGNIFRNWTRPRLPPSGRWNPVASSPAPPFAASASSHGCDAFSVHTRAWTTGRLASCAPAIVVQNIKTPQCSVILQKAVPRRDHRAPLEYLDIKNHHIRELHLIKRPGRWHNEGPPVQRSSYVMILY